MVSRAYLDYIKSDKWKNKRQEVFAFHGKKCYACSTRRGPFHCHHLTYARLGRENVLDLIPLCIPCHKEVTRIYKRNRRRGLRRVTMEFVNKKRANARVRNIRI